MKRSKKYNEVAKKVVVNQKYDLETAIKMMKDVSTSKFAGSIEMNMELNLTDKQKKDIIRGSYTLPNSFGKEVKVLVLCEANDMDSAKGADFVGGEDLVKEIEAGKNDFDIIITTPKMMPKIARLGKVIGSRGLMPNPKNGTITTDLATTIATFKSGKKNYKVSEQGFLSIVIGKVDMDANKVLENANAFIETLLNDTKKITLTPIKTLTVKPTMGLKVNVNVNSL